MQFSQVVGQAPGSFYHPRGGDYVIAIIEGQDNA